jgi:hypothetical protein
VALPCVGAARCCLFTQLPLLSAVPAGHALALLSAPLGQLLCNLNAGWIFSRSSALHSARGLFLVEGQCAQTLTRLRACGHTLVHPSTRATAASFVDPMQGLVYHPPGNSSCALSRALTHNKLTTRYSVQIWSWWMVSGPQPQI